MPWWDLSQITIQDLIQFTQPSGDPVYALPFQRIIDNFDFLKGRIRYGVGQPNFTPEQDTLLYVQIDTTPRSLWIWANNSWENFSAGTGGGTLDHKLLYGVGNPSDNPNIEKALYINKQNNSLWYWKDNQWILITGLGLSEQEVLTILDNKNLYGYIDLTNATEDYFLKRGEKAIIYADNVTSQPLRIATQSGTAYNLYVIPLNTGGYSGVELVHSYLNPNNTTYSNEFVLALIWRNNFQFTSTYTTWSSFNIGWRFYQGMYFICNITQHKAIVGIYNHYGESYGWPTAHLLGTVWRNTETPWTSLGTIVWPQASSAYILVHRIF